MLLIKIRYVIEMDVCNEQRIMSSKLANQAREPPVLYSSSVKLHKKKAPHDNGALDYCHLRGFLPLLAVFFFLCCTIARIYIKFPCYLQSVYTFIISFLNGTPRAPGNMFLICSFLLSSIDTDVYIQPFSEFPEQKSSNIIETKIFHTNFETGFTLWLRQA